MSSSASSKPPSPGLAAAARQLHDVGFCVLEKLYDEAACRAARRLIDGYWESSGRPRLCGQGFGIHPVLRKVPGMRPLFANAAVFEVIAAELGAEPILVRAGARLSNEDCDATLVEWHHHHQWNGKRVLARERIQRVLSVAYPDGTEDEVGPLALMPRALRDPLRAFGPKEGEWPGEIVLRLPPGSVVIFDCATWHTARRGSAAGHRRIFGGHYQAANLPDAHPDDIPGDAWRLADLQAPRGPA